MTNELGECMSVDRNGETPVKMCLEVADLTAGYGRGQVLHGVGLSLAEGAVHAVVGPNGAGKTTLLRCISGLLEARSGSIQLCDQDLTAVSPHKRARLGVAHVPEGRRLFPEMSTEENIRVGAVRRKDRARVEEEIDAFLAEWPVIERRRHSQATLLSGGEQQIVALGRALLARPKLLLLDEPSLGLAPILVDSLYQRLARLVGSGQTVLLVEQNVAKALELADSVSIMHGGELSESKPASELSADEIAERFFYGQTIPDGRE